MPERSSPYDVAGVEWRLLSGDPAALAQVTRWVGHVLSSAKFWSLRPGWSDLHQEVLLHVIDSLRRERFDPSRDFKAYVQAIARYTCLGALAARARSRDLPLQESLNAGETVEPDVLRLQAVRQALDMATEDCRWLIRAYFLEERGYAEIAAAADLPVGTVKSRLFRCLERVRQAIRRMRPRGRNERKGGDLA